MRHQEFVKMLRDPAFIEKYSEDVVKVEEEKTTEKFKFYGHQKGEQGKCFSNFSAHPVRAYGLEFPTTEHLF